MEHQVADQKIAGGVVIISHDGKIGLFHAYGQMDIEAKKPMKLDTIFRIYSMSKAITDGGRAQSGRRRQDRRRRPGFQIIPSFANLKVASDPVCASRSGR